VDVDGHADDENVARALASLPSICVNVKHLGSYPKARPEVSGTTPFAPR